MKLFYNLNNLKVRQIIYLIKYRLIDYFFCSVKKFFFKAKYKNLDLNISININNLNRKVIFDKNFNWNNINDDMLFRYNLHYFDFLHDINIQHVSEFKVIILNWIENNFQLNSVGYDPYPTSIRLINWIQFVCKYKIEDKNINFSVIEQSKWLSKNLEYHIDANHLLTNLRCIIYLLNYDKAHENIFNKSIFYNFFIKELSNQILEDGGHYERSPSYHLLILNDLFKLYEFLENRNDTKNYEFKNIIINNIFKMKIWLEAILHPDNNIPFFNDSNFNKDINIPNLLNKINLLLNKKNLNTQNLNNEKFISLNDTGYYIYNNNFYKLISSISNFIPHFQPGHSHANTLSFELSVGKNRLFVNSGINTYNNNKYRINQRSTSSQNTVEINSLNSSDIWSSFRVGKRARIVSIDKIINSEKVVINSSHDGYSNLFKKILHKRKFEISDKFIIIHDEIVGTFKSAVVHFHLHPDVRINGNKLILFNKIVNFEINNEFVVKDSEWYPEFNIAKTNKKILIYLNNNNKKNFFKLSF